MNFVTADFNEILNAVTADGRIDIDEADSLHDRWFADGVVTREEAEEAFEIANATAGADNAPRWNEVFAETVGTCVLNDPESPGVIDVEEDSWLADNIEGDEQVSPAEVALLAYIRDHAKKVGPRVQGLIDTNL